MPSKTYPFFSRPHHPQPCNLSKEELIWGVLYYTNLPLQIYVKNNQPMGLPNIFIPHLIEFCGKVNVPTHHNIFLLKNFQVKKYTLVILSILIRTILIYAKKKKVFPFHNYLIFIHNPTLRIKYLVRIKYLRQPITTLPYLPSTSTVRKRQSTRME